MRVLTSFSLLGGTARRRAQYPRVVHAATVKPGGISRRRNLNSWKSEWEGTVGGGGGKDERERESRTAAATGGKEAEKKTGTRRE